MTQSHRSRTSFQFALLIIAFVVSFAFAPIRRLSGQSQQNNRQLERDSSRSGTNGRRTALIIGNGAYTNAPPLKNPPNDARDMAVTLNTLGFEVTSGINVNQREMKNLIREFGRKLRAGGSGLFYYAGHGVQSKGRNYLIPIEADIQSETDVEDQGVDVALILGLMDEANNGLNVVILDACRNNPFARSFRAISNGLAQVDAPSGTLIAYSTSPGKAARDGEGRNGAYTTELLKQMRVPGLRIEELLKRVRASLKQQTNGEQVPWESSSLIGDLYLNRVPTSGGAPANPTTGAAGPLTTADVGNGKTNSSLDSTLANSKSSDDGLVSLDKVMTPAFARDYVSRSVRVKAQFIGAGQTQGWLFTTIPAKVMDGKVAFRVSAPNQAIVPETAFGSVPPHVFIDRNKSDLVFELKSGEVILLEGSTVVGQRGSFTQVVFVATSIKRAD